MAKIPMVANIKHNIDMSFAATVDPKITCITCRKMIAQIFADAKVRGKDSKPFQQKRTIEKTNMILSGHVHYIKGLLLCESQMKIRTKPVTGIDLELRNPETVI